MEKVTICFAKTRDVKSPSRGTNMASGFDLYVPTFDDKFIKDLIEKNPDISVAKKDHYEWVIINSETEKFILLSPHARICIPSGIKLGGIEGISYNMHNKSGIATKKGLVYAAEVVDADYQGEVHISLINTTNYMIRISEGEKIVQLLAERVFLGDLKECTEDELYSGQSSERGENWQGSTGDK